MTAKLMDSLLINETRTPIARLLDRYEIAFPELWGRFSQLKIWPKEIDRTLYVDDRQLQALDELHTTLEEHSGKTFLYRCNQTGNLQLSSIPLHTDRQEQQLYDNCKEANTFPGDTIEFIASGPYEQIIGLAHSIMLGIHNQMQGI